MHTVGGRLKVWRESLPLKQEEAAAHLGLSASTYQNYERDTRSPNAAGWEAFARGGINTNWLLTGEGPQLTRDLAPAAARSAGTAKVLTDRNEDYRVDVQRPDYVAIPLYSDISASAGHGAVVPHEQADDALVFKTDWLRLELGAKPQDLRLIRISGDSMEPTLRSGDVILVDHRACRPDREGIYIIRLGEMLLVKRLQALPGGKVRVTSDNAAFDPWTLDLAEVGGDVAIVGRVVWSGRRM